jgi:uncharacterized cupin superfamily protein
MQKPNTEDLEKRGVLSWPIWEKEISRFDWHYETIEEFYLLEGKVAVETKDRGNAEFRKADFVTFPKGYPASGTSSND